MKQPADGLYIMLISVHGLVRGYAMELGRDADTGGQVKYVVELAKALAAHPRVARVDLLTRQVNDPKVDESYAAPEEPLAAKARIVRIPCGPCRYLRKEVLWPYLDNFADNALQHIRRVGRVPDVIHSHYADAGYLGARLAALLGVPLIYTGHSLGREKKRRLLDQGLKSDAIEKQYNMTQRIEAEEFALDNAALVVASTRQEVERQYRIYDNYQPERMQVIPPGVDLSHYHAPDPQAEKPAIYPSVSRFLSDPGRPMILALSRADQRKNIGTLLKAYGEHPVLREQANLVLVAGNRDDIAGMDKSTRGVLTEMLLLIDRYDLYGKAAYPKQHQPDDVPDFYRLAAQSRGVFVNPALTEPFGLTLIEAAASGLPVVATEDGGPRDIVDACKNGLLIDPLDIKAMGETIHSALSDGARWTRWSEAGLAGAQNFSWSSHVESYMKALDALRDQPQRRQLAVAERNPLPSADRLLVSDIDNTLIGDRYALRKLIEHLRRTNDRVGFGVATGRRLDSALQILKEWQVPTPDLIVTAVGTEIYYGSRHTPDVGYQRHLAYRWQPSLLQEAMGDIPGILPQPASEQLPFKLSYFVAPDAPPIAEIARHLRRRKLHANVVYSHGLYLDLLPVRASKGCAIRYLAMKWSIPVEHILVVGDSGNDEEMLSGNTLGVVVGNHSEELEKLRGREHIYFAEGRYAWGILEGIEHYDFFGAMAATDSDKPEEAAHE